MFRIRPIDQRRTSSFTLEIFTSLSTLRSTRVEQRSPQSKVSGIFLVRTTKNGFFRSRDLWFVGTLIWEIFNGNGATSAASYRQLGAIPRPLAAAYGELVQSNPSQRSSLEKLVQSPFIQNNSLVECLLFLEQIQVSRFSFLSNNHSLISRRS